MFSPFVVLLCLSCFFAILSCFLFFLILLHSVRFFVIILYMFVLGYLYHSSLSCVSFLSFYSGAFSSLSAASSTAILQHFLLPYYSPVSSGSCKHFLDLPNSNHNSNFQSSFGSSTVLRGKCCRLNPTDIYTH